MERMEVAFLFAAIVWDVGGPLSLASHLRLSEVLIGHGQMVTRSVIDGLENPSTLSSMHVSYLYFLSCALSIC